MPDRPPKYDTYGRIEYHPCECGQHLVPTQFVTPEDNAKLAEWDALSAGFEARIAPHPDSPLDEYGEYRKPASEHDPRCPASRNYEAPCFCPDEEPATRAETHRFMAVIVAGCLIWAAIIIWWVTR